MLVLFAVLGVVLEEKSEGGEAKQEGLEAPEAARGRVVDALVAAATRKEQHKSGVVLLVPKKQPRPPPPPGSFLKCGGGKLPAHFQGHKGLKSMDGEGSPPPAAEKGEPSARYPSGRQIFRATRSNDGSHVTPPPPAVFRKDAKRVTLA